MIKTKICGISNELALNAALVGGASFIGFVHFARSPRHVELVRALELSARLPDEVASVLVTVDPSDALLKDIVKIVSPSYIQLHGDESPERVAAIRKRHPSQKLIKALGVATKTDLDQAKAYENLADMLLFDAKPISSPNRGEAGRGASVLSAGSSGQESPHPGPLPKGEGEYLPGGNGIAFDWSLMQGFQSPLPWMLSGGLTPENVQAAIRESGAKMVDVSSGVECAPGVKDAQKISAFLKAAQ